MIEGAIIGAFVGILFSVVLLLKRTGRRKKVLATFEERGAAAAGEALDAAIKPLAKIPLGKILDQCERMAGLALVDDREAMEREIAEHHGALTAVTQVNAVALLGLTVRGDAEEGARRLEELAEKIEQEGGRTLALVKRKTRSLAVLARGVAGAPIPVEQRMNIDKLADDGGMVQLLIWQALATALAAEGKEAQAKGLAAKVRQATSAYSPAAKGPTAP